MILSEEWKIDCVGFRFILLRTLQIPVFTLSPICNSDILTDLLFSRTTEEAPEKQLLHPQHTLDATVSGPHGPCSYRRALA